MKAAFVLMAAHHDDTMRRGPGNPCSSLERAGALSIDCLSPESSQPAFWLDRGRLVGCDILDVGDARREAASSPTPEWGRHP